MQIFFKNDILHLKCFFHFANAIKNKLKKLQINKNLKEIDILTVEINVKLICFIDIQKVEEYKKFLIEHIKKYKKFKTFIDYLNDNWFNRNVKYYNYSTIIQNYYNKNELLNKLYLTNNIVESIHSKLNYNLPKHKTTKLDFIKSIENILLNDLIKKEEIIRNDFKTKTYLILIKKEKLNDTFKWIEYKKFNNYLREVKKLTNFGNIDSINKLIEQYDNHKNDELEYSI